MAIFPNSLVVEVSNILERFNINSSPEQVASLANFYWNKRPSKPARPMAEVMTGVPGLPWPPIFNTTQSRIEVMRILIDRLDCQYWVDTFEHDRAEPFWMRNGRLIGSAWMVRLQRIIMHLQDECPNRSDVEMIAAVDEKFRQLYPHNVLTWKDEVVLDAWCRHVARDTCSELEQ